VKNLGNGLIKVGAFEKALAATSAREKNAEKQAAHKEKARMLSDMSGERAELDRLRCTATEQRQRMLQAEAEARERQAALLREANDARAEAAREVQARRLLEAELRRKRHELREQEGHKVMLQRRAEQEQLLLLEQQQEQQRRVRLEQQQQVEQQLELRLHARVAQLEGRVQNARRGAVWPRVVVDAALRRSLVLLRRTTRLMDLCARALRLAVRAGPFRPSRFRPRLATPAAAARAYPGPQ
jgi:hypothetical protein